MLTIKTITTLNLTLADPRDAFETCYARLL